MSFQYKWKNKEANFGPPLKEQVPGGMHLTLEIILKKDGQYIALRRSNGIPEHELPENAQSNPRGLLYFCHDLIRYGESVGDSVKRIVQSQAGVGVVNSQVVYVDSLVQDKDDSWAVTPHIIAEVDRIPELNLEMSEVVIFDLNNIPEDFAWWNKEDLKEFLEEFDQ